MSDPPRPDALPPQRGASTPASDRDDAPTPGDRDTRPEGPASHAVASAADIARRRDADRRYWRANLRLMAGLLCVWALVSFGFGIVWVETLNRFSLGGFPLGFWFAQQGAIYTFILLIFVYAFTMDRIEARRRAAERAERAQRQA
jgi:putative solute:sodium symporter small subunit